MDGCLRCENSTLPASFVEAFNDEHVRSVVSKPSSLDLASTGQNDRGEDVALGRMMVKVLLKGCDLAFDPLLEPLHMARIAGLPGWNQCPQVVEFFIAHTSIDS